MSQEIKEILKDENKVKLIAQKAFETIDTDGGGTISLDELEDLMRDMAQLIGIPPPTTAEVQYAFKEIKQENENEIHLEEFINLVRDILKLMAN